MNLLLKYGLTFGVLLATGYANAADNSQDSKSLSRQCTALKDTHLYNTAMKSALWLTDGTIGNDLNAAFTGATAGEVKAQPHCVVEGEIEPRIGADGKHYGINFQLRLPENWNGKFLFQGGGGANGFLAPAVGKVPLQNSSAIPALLRGYAVVSMDSGHQGGVMNLDFAADQQAKIDYAYAATGKVTERAKTLIEQFYRQKPQYSYFMGCSTGGREAMIAAQRYPNEFDGVVSANAAYHLSRAALGATKNYQLMTQYAQAHNTDIKDIFTQADLEKIAQAVLKQCDAKDGLEDGIINAWEQCDFNPNGLSADLGEAKTALLKAFFGPKQNSRGETYHTGYPYDSAVNQASWQRWWLDDKAANYTLTVPLLTHYFAQPNSGLTALSFDFDNDIAKIDNTAGLNDADSPNLSTFNANGGKMIIIDGLSDPIFSPYDRRDWYRAADKATVDVQNFARWFVVPGMTHCGGGNALDDFDPLSALENWREQGKAPDFILTESNAFPGKEMPVCAYPKVATYIGGDKNSASSFKCLSAGD